MMSLRFNQKSWSIATKKLFDKTEEDAKEELKDIASYIIRKSPVQTGAYITSHSVSYSNGGVTRSRSSNNKPKIEVEEGQAIAQQQMFSDIENLDFIANAGTSIKFTNRAPHAQIVEDKYQVYGSTKDVGT